MTDEISMSVEDKIVNHIRDHIADFTRSYMKENDIDFFNSALDEVREIMETAINTEIDGEGAV